MTPDRDSPQSQSQPPRVRRASSVADAQKMRTISAHIFAEIFPRWPRRQPRDGTASLAATAVHAAFPPAARAKKEILPMQAYRTKSIYYFSSKQLLPAGSLVFFSTKLRRYVHPTAGTLLDGYPRLEILPVNESQELETQWHEELVKY